jgi:prevent-host-death family protein
MRERGAAPARVGVRELRQNLSVYLERVTAGETLDVTEHGHPVARLGPRPSDDLTAIQRLVAEGRATPSAGDLGEWLRARPGLDWPADGPSLSNVLIEMREEERS